MRILDLFCGAGGAAMGLHRQWRDAEIVGVDIKLQKRYPFRFIQEDAMTYNLAGFDFIWASPPCQCFTALKSVFDSSKYEDLVDPIRQRLLRSGSPFVIENVVGAPLRKDLMLCANAFGLRSYRHRIFEASFPLVQIEHPKHIVRVNQRKKNRRGHWDAGGFVTVVGDIGSYVGPEAMGIDWMTGHELSQAIPPAYSQYIAQQFDLWRQSRP
jgi:DNA (cytosine-5)-methyltransferase 1